MKNLRPLWNNLKKRLAPHLRVGAEGERFAAGHLRGLGYRILERNVRFKRRGEIDIVAEEGGDLVFVEVKTRRVKGEYSALWNITPAKRRKLIQLARLYCAERGASERAMRFDVIGVEGWGGGRPEVTLIKFAFREERR